MALFCVVFRRDSVSLLKFPFLGHVQVFSCEIIIIIIIIITWFSFGLVWFYGISTFVGYLTPNPFLCN